MIEILNRVLKQYSYVKHDIQLANGIEFYKHENEKVASYFIVNHIDCRTIEDDEEAIKLALGRLEEYYSVSGKEKSNSMKLVVQNSFDNLDEASQIDKNTSAIYLLCFNDLKNLNRYRNLIFAIEESPNYFKRYVVPYTERQANSLVSTVKNYEEREINDILSDLAYNEDEYYKLLEGRNEGSQYEFVIRLFSKIPFLQYKFKADPSPLSLESDIMSKIDTDLESYHKMIENQTCDIDSVLLLEDSIEIEDSVLEEEFNRRLGGVS